VEPLLSNDRETNNKTAAVTMQHTVNRGTVFSAWFEQMAAHATMDTATEEWFSVQSVPGGYKQDN
jgi:hypothetical protein